MSAACSAVPGKPPVRTDEARTIEVAEVRRLTVCNTAGTAAQLSPLPDIEAVRRWQTLRGVDLFGDGDAGPVLPPGPFVMIELGARNVGGYGIAIRGSAEAVDNELTLHGNFLAPAEPPMRTPMPISPCVLVALPEGSRFAALRLLDQAGDLQAQYLRPAASSPVIPAQ
jgi:hypothetical protein